MSQFNLFLKRDPSRMSTPPTKPKRSTFAVTAGLTTTPEWGPDEWARHYARGKASAEKAAAHRFFCNCGEYSPCEESALRFECKHCLFEYARASVDCDWQAVHSVEAIDHGGVVLAGDTWGERKKPRWLVTAVDGTDVSYECLEGCAKGEHGRCHTRVLIDGYFLHSRAQKAERAGFDLGSLVRVISDDDRRLTGEVGVVAGRGKRGRVGTDAAVWVTFTGRTNMRHSDGAFWFNEDELELVKLGRA